MYIPSLSEFSSLNYGQKIQIVENIQNIIEAQRKKYLKNNSNEILISTYYPKNKEFCNINITDDDSSSSSSVLSDDNQTISENCIIEKAKNNIINIKKDIEDIQLQYHFFKLENEKYNNKIKEAIPDQEINYTIETTNYNNNDSFIDYKNDHYKENTKNTSNNKTNIPFNFFDTFRNYQESNFSKEKESKKYEKELLNSKKIKSRKINTPYTKTISISSCKNKNLFQSKSTRNYTKSHQNLYDTNKNDDSYNIEKIKKKLNFNKMSKNKKNQSLMKIIFRTQRKNINTQISERLYNMHKIIKEKINKKKKEIDEEEMKNCSFKPKINDKSRKIAEKIEKNYENKNKIYKKINIYKLLNKN